MTILGISPVLIGNFAGTLCSLLTLFDCGLGTFSMLLLGPRILLLIFTSSQVALLLSLSVPLSVTLISSTEFTSTSSASEDNSSSATASISLVCTPPQFLIVSESAFVLLGAVVLYLVL